MVSQAPVASITTCSIWRRKRVALVRKVPTWLAWNCERITLCDISCQSWVTLSTMPMAPTTSALPRLWSTKRPATRASVCIASIALRESFSLRMVSSTSNTAPAIATAPRIGWKK